MKLDLCEMQIRKLTEDLLESFQFVQLLAVGVYAQRPESR